MMDEGSKLVVLLPFEFFYVTANFTRKHVLKFQNA